MSILSRLFGSGARAARAEAVKRGVAVAEVERQVPIFARGNRLEGLEPGRCVRYSLPRRPGGFPNRWAFLQRGRIPDAPFPNGWQLEASGETVPQELTVELLRIATEWTEELLEFEADDATVSAYWEEWGGAGPAGTIVGYLQRLAAF